MEILNNQLRTAEENNDPIQIQALTTVKNSVKESIKVMNKKHNNIVWPSSTKNGPRRTVEKVFKIVNNIENNEILGPDEAKGIEG